MRRPWWGGVLLLASCARLGGCFGNDQPIVYVDLVDEASQAPGAPGRIERAALEGAMRDVMRAWPGHSFRTAKPGEIPWQVDLRIVFMSERAADEGGGVETDPRPPGGGVSRAVGVRMRLKSLRVEQRGADGKFATEFVHRAWVSADTTWSELAAEAVRRAGEELGRAIRLSRAPPEEVVEALAHENERVRARAAVVAGDRKLSEAVPTLMERVRDENEAEQVVLRSIGALVAIRDPAAASALIDAGRRRTSAYVAQIVFALGELGGREAEAYLFTVASGHPDPALRKAARQALDGLEARRDAKDAGRGEPGASETGSSAP